MLINHVRQRGVTIIEMMIAISIISILMLLALPSMSTWLNNSQIRTAGETMLNGITLARSEALHRNTTVRFQLTTTLDSSCSLSATGTSWVVSLADPTGLCDVSPSDTTAPQIIQRKSGMEGSPRAQITANGGTTTIFFNGLGRPVNPGGVATITQIDITNPGGGVCQNVDPANGPMRCLRITISTGGESKMCDPAVTDNTDPRFC